jgi:PhzF family phenazine biosynthesis protein
MWPIRKAVALGVHRACRHTADMPTHSGPVDAAVLHLAAFPGPTGGGNPAGVVLDMPPGELPETRMRRIAEEVGHSETAFLMDGPVSAERRRYAVRYLSPAGEVSFCGHATIALTVALAQRIGPGSFVLDTVAGTVPVDVWLDESGAPVATLTSVQPTHRDIPDDVLGRALACFGWSRSDLDPRVPPAVAYAGAWHLVLVLSDRELLRSMRYDYEALRHLSLEHGWVTVHVAHWTSPELHQVRAPFPFGNVLEDPATGAGAAAYGAYLRDSGALPGGGRFRILQGEDMGRPSLLQVEVPPTGPVLVTGAAVPL